MDIFLSTYTYLTGSLIGIFLTAVLYIFNKKYRRSILINGLAFGILGVILEYYFLQDYWNPPLVLRLGALGGIEDLFFGFAAGGIGSTLPLLVTQEKFSDNNSTTLWPYLVTAIIQITFIIVGWKYGINSIYSSSIGFLLIALWVMAKNPTLILRSLTGVVLCTIILIIGEGLLLITIAPNYLSQYFLLHDKVAVFGGMFISTEIVWGACFGAYISIIQAPDERT